MFDNEEEKEEEGFGKDLESDQDLLDDPIDDDIHDTAFHDDEAEPY